MFTEKELAIVEGLVRRKLSLIERRTKVRTDNLELRELEILVFRSIMLKLQQEREKLLTL